MLQVDYGCCNDENMMIFILRYVYDASIFKRKPNIGGTPLSSPLTGHQKSARLNG